MIPIAYKFFEEKFLMAQLLLLYTPNILINLTRGGELRVIKDRQVKQYRVFVNRQK